MTNEQVDRSKLPMPQPPFGGKIGQTYQDSKSEWPKLPTPSDGAPNVVIILLDDVGFGQVSTFGGPVPTPHLDQLAASGLRYTRFHTTAICGPSRAALITGRNHHNCGSGFLAEWATGFPSYNNLIPRSTATVGSILKFNGYATSWFGKNHNTPDWESSVAGPFDRWPQGLGFDYFYGFIGGETHQYYPVIFENTTAVEPATSPEEGYHFMTDMTDKAINWLRYSKSVAPQKPVLLYFAPGAAHAPHHAPKEWREKFKGKFDAGWDAVRQATYERQLKLGIIASDTKLTPRPEWVKPWDGLSADEKRLYARFMENFAGYLAFTDAECGRLLEVIRQLPDADNTLIFYIVGDNGASSEGGMSGTVNEVMNLNGVPSRLEDNLKMLDEIGGPHTEPHYPLGWAWAGNCPFQWVKQVASHLGGSRNPMVVSWPARIKDAGGIRDQFTHLIDIVPTILDVAKLPAPTSVEGIEQKPMDGVSIASTFDNAKAKPVRQRQFSRFSRIAPFTTTAGSHVPSTPPPGDRTLHRDTGRTTSGNSTTLTKISARQTIWPQSIRTNLPRSRKSSTKRRRKITSTPWMTAAPVVWPNLSLRPAVPIRTDRPSPTIQARLVCPKLLRPTPRTDRIGSPP
jgi:arylsulfatase A-like enzyme